MTIRRAWSGHVAEGELRDHFANTLVSIISEREHESAMAGFPPELVEDFVERCDAIFADAEVEPRNCSEVKELAALTDTTELYDLVGE